MKELADNADDWFHEYKIIVQTGIRPGAGTKSTVCFDINGYDHSTGTRMMKGFSYDVSRWE